MKWPSWEKLLFTPASVDDDLVSVSTKDFCVYFTISICFWLFSFVLISMQIFEHGHFISPNVLLFLPMWFGSLGGIVSAVLIVYRIGNTMIVSRERRLLMRAQGYEYGGRMIEQESLPLLRMLIGWSAIAVVSFLLAFISQVLFYLWFIQRGIGIWHALVPTCIMIVIYLAFVYTVEFFSRVSCTVISLLSLELVLFALKVDNGLSYLGWDVVSIPAIVVLLVAYRYLSELLYSLWVTDYYQFSALQVRCLGMYTVALVLVSVALVLSVCSSVERPFHQHIDHHKDMTAVLKALASVLFVDGAPGVDEPPREEDIDIDRGDIGGGEIDRGEIGSIDVDAVKDDPFPDPSIESYSYSLDPSVPSLDPVPLLLWTIAMVLMTAASLMIFNDEIKHIAKTRGFEEPIPLIRSRRGWEPAGAAVTGVVRATWWPMLGRLVCARASLQDIARSHGGEPAHYQYGHLSSNEDSGDSGSGSGGGSGSGSGSGSVDNPVGSGQTLPGSVVQWGAGFGENSGSGPGRIPPADTALTALTALTAGQRKSLGKGSGSGSGGKYGSIEMLPVREGIAKSIL